MSYEHWPYLCVLVVLIATSFGMPIPEDISLLTGGYLCNRGLASLYIMIAVGMVGVLAGDVVLFTLGRVFGHRVVEHRVVRRLVHPSRLLLAEHLFQRHGVKIIFAGRFLPGLRPMIWVASGVLKVRFWKFAAVNGFAACISVPTLIVLGKVFGHNLDKLKSEVRTVTHLLVLVILTVGLAAFTIYWHRRQKRMLALAGLDRKIDRETLIDLPPGGNVPIPEPDMEDQESPPPDDEASSPMAASGCVSSVANATADG